MHNDETRQVSTKQIKSRDRPKKGILDNFIDMMKLEEDEEDEYEEVYENDKPERSFIIISVVIPFTILAGVIIAVIIFAI